MKMTTKTLPKSDTIPQTDYLFMFHFLFITSTSDLFVLFTQRIVKLHEQALGLDQKNLHIVVKIMTFNSTIHLLW